ncbi:metal-dependent hydrolase [Haloferula sargassicola]|uniref:metal-dependent hydrolase n=1 Tax=Haloferula sargassicola TaxID=490096 RepID=UPI0033654B51
MDPITQAALGAIVGALMLGRQLGRPAIGWGALFGLLPGIDFLLLPFVDTVWDLRIHRGFTHSLLFVVPLAWLLAKPLSKRWKKHKVTPARAGWFVFLALAGHVLLACFTVSGAQVLWPVPMPPVSLDNLPASDPLFALPLLVAVVRGLFIEAKRWKKGAGLRFTAVCLAISSAYVGVSFWAKSAVSRAAVADLDRRGISWQRKMEAPAPCSILLWRVVARHGDELWVGYRSIFDGDKPLQWTIFRKDTAALDEWDEHAEVATVRWISKDWCLGRPRAGGIWLVDLRFGEYREWDARGLALRPVHAWDYRLETRGDPMKTTIKDDRDTKAMMARLWRRICGDQEGWEDRPRLIGDPGRPHEFLGSVR